MNFWKMNGLGNDYVYVLDLDKKVNNESELAIKVSERHFGIGSDGLVLIRMPEDKSADFRMDMYNADGSQAEMCGNAIRCVGKYVYDNELTDKEHIAIETLAGIKYLQLNIVNNKVGSVRVDMGAPILNGIDIPVCIDKEPILMEPINVNNKQYQVTCVSMGNPHAIYYVDDVASLDLDEIGSYFENHVMFPKKTNSEFVKVIDKNNLEMRVYERGSGETLACGTGACATLVATYLNGMCSNKANVHLLGGVLEIEYDTERNTVFMTGPCEVQFIGEYLK